MRRPELSWAVGLTTCVQRRGDVLPRTLASLRAGGFEPDRLFVDGCNDYQSWRNQFGIEVTCHYPHVRTFGNFVLGLGELYIRHPRADRYLMCQDDFVCVRNLRDYLSRIPYQKRTYLNLYTFPKNAARRPEGLAIGFYPSDQRGKGAVALVFDRETVITLLTHLKMVERPLTPIRGMTNVDGGIVNALKTEGYTELVHAPSLTQHIGLRTSMRDFDRRHPPSQPLAIDFPGEDFDALSLLTAGAATPVVPAGDLLPPARWAGEVAALRRAIAEDEARMRGATPAGRARLQRIISDYRRQLARYEQLLAGTPEGKIQV